MLGYGPSSSGRVSEGSNTERSQSRAFVYYSFPAHQPGSRTFVKPRSLRCNALALPSKLRLHKVLHQLLRTGQGSPVEALLIESGASVQSEQPLQANTLQSWVKHAGNAALYFGVKVRQQTAEAKRQLDVEMVKQYENRRENLRQHGKDVAFMQMLQSLDRIHLDHDAKWALVQKHTADKADFCESLQHLYKAACNSKEAVETLLRPDATRKEINRFWKSKQTAAIIAQEQSLKQLVFAQMLQGA